MKTFPRRTAWLVVAALALLASGCRDQAPEDSFRQFYVAVSKGDADGAWQSFSQDTQQQLERTLEAARPPGSANKPAKELLFERGLLRTMREIVQIEVLTRSRGKAVLQVIDESGDRQQVTMVLEQGAWKVQLDLSGAGA